MNKGGKSQFSELGEVLDRLLKNLGIDRRVREVQALTLWEEVAGSKIAERTRPLKVEDGKLFIEVHNSTWRAELLLLKPRILRKINQRLGADILRDIVFL